MSAIAIFGGTFNPPHIGHYQMLDSLCNIDFIDKVLVIPTKIPPHKTCDYLADEEDRISMCKLLCEDFPKAQLSLVDIEREGKSYSLYTIRELKKIYPNSKIYFALGGDMLNTLDTWYKWQDLIKEVSFLGFARGSNEQLKADTERLKSLGADIKLLRCEITDVSSTKLRNTLNPDLIPPKVYDYIKQRKLYNGT